jgi:hypothetical protein
MEAAGGEAGAGGGKEGPGGGQPQLLPGAEQPASAAAAGAVGRPGKRDVFMDFPGLVSCWVGLGSGFNAVEDAPASLRHPHTLAPTHPQNITPRHHQDDVGLMCETFFLPETDTACWLPGVRKLDGSSCCLAAASCYRLALSLRLLLTSSMQGPIQRSSPPQHSTSSYLPPQRRVLVTRTDPAAHEAAAARRAAALADDDPFDSHSESLSFLPESILLTNQWCLHQAQSPPGMRFHSAHFTPL